MLNTLSIALVITIIIQNLKIAALHIGVADFDSLLQINGSYWETWTALIRIVCSHSRCTYMMLKWGMNDSELCEGGHIKQQNTSKKKVPFISFPKGHLCWTKWPPMQSTDWITSASQFDPLQFSSTIRWRSDCSYINFY